MGDFIGAEIDISGLGGFEDLAFLSGSDNGGGDGVFPQDPGDGKLGQRYALVLGDGSPAVKQRKSCTDGWFIKVWFVLSVVARW